MPETLKGTYAEASQACGFSWKEFAATVPSPLLLVTAYKQNGQPNACMQSWAAFISANQGKGFYAILGSVDKNGHLYAILHEKKEAVINFVPVVNFEKCMATIKNNQPEADGISVSGLTPCPASWVDAPLVDECLMNLECRYQWEKEIVPGDDHALICLEVVGAHIDEAYLTDRTGDQGVLFNIHHPQNPELTEKNGHDYAGIIRKKLIWESIDRSLYSSPVGASSAPTPPNQDPLGPWTHIQADYNRSWAGGKATLRCAKHT